MFTVKLYAFNDGGRITQTSIQCPHYEVLTHDHGWTIITYPGMTAENGVERHLMSEGDRSYDICYVENSAGKTIDSYDMGKHPLTAKR